MFLFSFTQLIDSPADLSIYGTQVQARTTPPHKFENKSVNTDTANFYSLTKWHGANWQKKLPAMYLPRKQKHDTYESVPVRTKLRPARFRHASESI